ncbi:MAG: ROK family protein [Bacteroidetes bacterium]|jgi:glucokinase|nr:ROK family protein [Bacteroidota bacterium]MBT6685754.1 ROK family protein [Bacteroidota bacterium]
MKEVSIGIDIGGTNTVFGVVDKDAKVLAEGSISTRKYENVDEFIELLSNSLKRLIENLENDTKVKGIGIGAPNGNYYTGSIDFAPNLRWKGKVKLAEKLEKEMNYPVFLTNDANAAAMGEMIYGGAKNMNDFIVITLGTGLGSGIVVDGKVVYGHDGFAGEIGHTVINPEGRTCGCGRLGCLETYASATGILKTVLELLKKSDEASELRNFVPEKITSKLIAEAANRSDKMALEAFEFTGKILGFALANAVATLSPKAIFLFGGLAKSGELIIKPTKIYLEENLLNIFKNKVQILPSGIPDQNAAILGASALVWEN